MEQDNRPPEQTGMGRSGPEMRDQSALKRAAHKIAWTRMNGRNDELNPFANGAVDGPSPGDSRQS